jgi:hypothetical protein
MHNRSERRAKKALMKTKAKQVYPWMKNPVILADHLKNCSCYMCGNPRRWWREKTLKEKQFVAIPIDLE